MSVDINKMKKKIVNHDKGEKHTNLCYDKIISPYQLFQHEERTTRQIRFYIYQEGNI